MPKHNIEEASMPESYNDESFILEQHLTESESGVAQSTSHPPQEPNTRARIPTGCKFFRNVSQCCCVQLT